MLVTLARTSDRDRTPFRVLQTPMLQPVSLLLYPPAPAVRWAKTVPRVALVLLFPILVPVTAVRIVAALLIEQLREAVADVYVPHVLFSRTMLAPERVTVQVTILIKRAALEVPRLKVARQLAITLDVRVKLTPVVVVRPSIGSTFLSTDRAP